MSIYKKIKNSLRFFIIFILISGIILNYYFIQSKIEKALALTVSNGDGLVVYGQSGNTTPQWRTYSSANNTFSSASGTVSGATGLQFIIRTSPTKQEAIAGYEDTSGNLRIMCYDGTSWSNEWSVAVGGTGTTRRFDIAYETNSGDVLVAYSANAAATNAVKYRTKLGSTGCGSSNWSAEQSMPTTTSLTTGTVHWVKAAWDRRTSSNLIAVIWADSNADLGGAIWDGSSFTNLKLFETSLEIVLAAQDVEDFGVAFESLSGDIMVVWANSAGNNGANGVRYMTCNGGTSSCTWSAVTTPPTWADDATNLDISADPNSDKILFASIGNAGSDLQYGVWDGSAWTNTANADISCATPAAGTKFVATGWLTSGTNTYGVVVYYDSGTTNIGWRTVSGTTWTSQTDWTPTPAFGTQNYYDIQVDPINKDRLILTVGDANSDFFAKRLILSGTTFTWSNADGGAALEANGSSASYEFFSFAYWRYIPTVIISITVSDGAISYGIIPANSSKSTCDLNDTQIVTNNGNVAETFNIMGSNSTNWTLGTSPGNEIYVHKFSTSSCPWTSGIPLTTSYQTMATNIAPNATTTLNLQITTPTNTNYFTQQNINVTIQAVQY